MPRIVRDRRRDLDPNHGYLVNSLVPELKDKSVSAAAMASEDAPKIIEEQMRNSDRLHVYVIWKGWDGVRENHRSAAILDAYENELGSDYARRIVIALGVTPEEAKKLGIRE